ncbi:MAG: alkaline phosphatase family protein [Candidatus Competibacterales bacterium]|nr:alkaline phosphatase family protein [Candidatus Competibacterales bacterium]
MASEITAPDHHHGLVALMGSLRRGLDDPHCPEPVLEALPPAEVAAARSVVLLIIDGLGSGFLREHGGALNGHLRTELSSVFPSSTAPAISSFMTGVAPGRHGVTGWFTWLRELGLVATVLPWCSRLGGQSLAALGADPAWALGACSVFDRLPVTGHYVIGRELVHSAYSGAAAGQARRHGYHDLNDCLERVWRLARARGGRRFIYAYWPRLDSLSHRHGCASEPVVAHWQMVAAALERLIEALRGSDTLLLITADHGFVDCDPAGVLQLGEHPELAETLALPLCGEPRAAFCYVRPERVRAFEHYVTTRLEHGCLLRRSADLLADGWFGPPPHHPRLAARIGDYVLLARDRHVLIDRLPGESPWSLIGVHGGVSAAEMRVPLLVAQG